MSTPIRILIVDDHPIVRRGIRETLLDSPRVEAIGEASTPVEALELARATPPWTVFLLDIGLPGRGGLDLLADLRREYPAIPALVLSMYAEEQYAIRALRAGAAGYLTKESAPDHLVTAVERIADGGRFITTTLAERLVMEICADPARPLHATLSGREFEVLKRIGNGASVSEIAAELSLSVKTVSGYRANVLQKLGLSNNAALMRYVLDHELHG